MSVKPETILGNRGERLQRAIGKVKGLQLTTPHRGELDVSSHLATVEIEPSDWIHVSMPLEARGPIDALKANYQFASNVRIASGAEETHVRADTMINGELHLANSFQEIRTSFERALGKKSARLAADSSDDLSLAAVQSAIERLPWNQDSIVQQDDGWELRPKVGGEPVPLQVRVDGSELRISRTLLDAIPAGSAGDAIADQALRFNKLLRLARLSIVKGCLVVESRLHGQLVNAYWIKTAAKAVAIASNYAETPLKILAKHESVSRLYAAMLLSSSSNS